jgi:GT2 family glycosyltransferase
MGGAAVVDGPPIAADVSVVVPTVGRPLLEGCLASIADGTTWPAELIVVDQGARPEVVGWIERLADRGLAITHLRSSERGIAAATNRGLEDVRTRFVATTHDDCRVRSDWLATLAERLPSLGDAILTGRVDPEGAGIVLTIVSSPDPATYVRPMIDRDVLFPPNMAFPVRLLERIGYLDEHPSLRLAGEDNEWAYRAMRAGVPIVYDPSIVVAHLARHDAEALRSLYERYARGQGAFYGKHLRRGDPFIARRVVRDLIRAPWLVVRGAVTGNHDLLAMGLGEVRGMPVGLLAGMRNAGARARERDVGPP